ncbi:MULTISPECIES: GGDEF domain-containing protein [Pseudomonas]|uniref:GGDEF domain-containing protein n=1 Tax=Pseudomonas TaxID=286 RepID=UPI001E4377F6|nr:MULTISPECIES: diguanylate cyclase [Pseudomonas]MCD5982671.1 GGDEF domain-containing protein [Pseudomonas sp. CDFA 610]MCQ9473716.1 GGDEF domain-containing protein [Pseudomonas alliivorans]
MLTPALDRPTQEDSQTLVEVERTIASGVRTLRFSRELERRYEADTQQQRRRFITAVGIGGGLIYNLYLLSDWLMLRDMFFYVAIGRLCVITPMFIALLLLIQRMTSRRALETTAAVGTVLSSLMPMVVMTYSESPHQLHYQLGMLLVMVYCTMIQQLPFRYATVATLSMLAIQLVTTYLAGFADFLTWQANALLFVCTVALLLMASYFLERGVRLSYLFALRGRLLHVQLMEVARTDALTRLFNRRYLDELVSSIWERSRETPTNVAFILLDIDHFKSYNDNYGHPQGDSCLKLMSQVIQQNAQQHGAVAFRYGGEEILILMVNTDASQAKALAEIMKAALATLKLPHPAQGEGALVTISLGVAAAIAPMATADQLINAADVALYAAKHAGRNCIRSA